MKSAILINEELVVNLYTIKNYLKTEIKFCGAKLNTNVNNDQMPKEGFYCICLSVILIDSVFKMSKSYYPQVILEEYK